MKRRYAILDVFTDRPLAGNPLAVVLDAEGLDERQMQAIAREFNLSETVFVLPPDNPVHSARIRIFLPGGELPFAGHPTVGTAVLLAGARTGGASREMVMVLEETVGPIRCGVFLKSERAGHAVFDVPQRPAPVEASLDREIIAGALELVPGEIGFENHQPTVYSAGVPYIFIPVRDLEAIGKARPNGALWSAAIGQVSHAIALYCRETLAGDHHFHARVFAPGVGVPEDPATGGAAAAFAGVIARFDAPPAGSHRYVIEQGAEMGRPGLIILEIDVDAGGIAAARVGGDAVIVATGALDL